MVFLCSSRRMRSMWL
uniref:Uncharacterized protein n=1 Tax=Arundo donax TaxID=35708 RepID=A0A0A9H7P1_ARUDO